MLSLLCFMLLSVFLTQDGALSYKQSIKLTSCRTNDMTFGECVNFNECEERQEENVFTFLQCRSKTCCPLSKLVKVTETPLTKVNDSKGCGWSNRVYDIQTSPGSATYGEFPWMIAVLRTSNTNKAWNQQDYIGGGSLIHPSVVLTAAHTVHRLTNEQLKCRAGEWNTQTPNEFYPYQERNVKKIIIHPDFHSKRGHNDIALLFLESPYDISSTISVACLGRTMAQVGTDCYSMGWGQRVFNNSDDHAFLLKKVPLPIVARRTCEYYLKNTILGPKFKLHDSLICAGGLQGVDTCTKDGGSPLVCPIGNDNGVSRYAVYGAVAFGIQCGQENVPGVYSSVPNVYEWLVATMVGEGMDTSQFVY